MLQCCKVLKNMISTVIRMYCTCKRDPRALDGSHSTCTHTITQIKPLALRLAPTTKG